MNSPKRYEDVVDLVRDNTDDLSFADELEIRILKKQVNHLKKLLGMAWVDYDVCPYEIGTKEIERLEVHPKAGLYRLDDKAILSACVRLQIEEDAKAS